MPRIHPDCPRILFLFSDTGGGHRSAAEAIIEALDLEYGDRISCQMVDFFKEYAPRPLNRMPSLYPSMVRLPRAWGFGYHLSNGRRRVRLIINSTWPYVRRAMRSMASNCQCDLIVSVHPLISEPLLRALGPNRPPFITVVTDLVTTHAFWYNRRVDLCLVPSEEAYRRALFFGMRSEQVRIVGLPVAERFTAPPGDVAELRARFGWPQDRPVILLVGGGEGMGPLESTALAIASGCPSVGLVIVAGRNEKLQRKLENMNWSLPTRVYGFVREMPDFMRAANILVTKAGPGTISEALIAGLPMVLYSRLPGQEDGNVTYVASAGAGVWAPKPERVAHAIQNWLDHPEQYEEAIAACRRLARPQAARQIARILANYLELPVSQEIDP